MTRTDFRIRFADAAYELGHPDARAARAFAREQHFESPRSLTTAIAQARAYREAGIEVLFLVRETWRRTGHLEVLGSMSERDSVAYFDVDGSPLDEADRLLRQYDSRRAYLKTTPVRWANGKTRRGKLLALQVEYRTLGLDV